MRVPVCATNPLSDVFELEITPALRRPHSYGLRVTYLSRMIRQNPYHATSLSIISDRRFLSRAIVMGSISWEFLIAPTAFVLAPKIPITFLEWALRSSYLEYFLYIESVSSPSWLRKDTSKQIHVILFVRVLRKSRLFVMKRIKAIK